MAAFALAAVSPVPLSVASRAASAQSRLPAALASFLTEEAHATPAEREVLVAGNPLVKLLDADPGKEIAVLGAVWVNAPSRLYVEQVKNIEQFERGGAFRITKRISDPPRPDDFAALTLSDQDFEDLKDCRIGDCALKLDADGVQTLRAEVDWGMPTAKADATALFRRLALQYVNGYREGGNANLGVHRDKDRPTFVANEFRSLIERLPRLGAELPDLTRFLLDYPDATLANSTDFLYWQETQFGLRPTIRISHLVIQERPNQTVVASKMLYANHYFWTALELRVLLLDPARGPGFWLVTINRSRSDGLSGFTGRVIRSRVRGEVEDGTRAALTATKTRLESKGGRP
ncbi:MAG: hypothetical protein AB7N65_16690 [Vicinamibacterales bacterium]